MWHRESKPAQVFSSYIRIIFYSLAVGLAVGLGVSALMALYHAVAEIRVELVAENKLFVVAVPAVGVLAAYSLIKRFGSSKGTGGGSHRLLEAYHYEGGRVTLRDTILSPLASAVTIGSGGSAGFEGPCLLLGGGLGSVVAQKLNLRGEELRTLLLAGASAGIAAVFKAPLTGIMFGLEVPFKRDIARRAFIPATLASISSYIVATSILGGERLFPVLPDYTLPLGFTLIHAFLLGLIVALVGAAFVKAYGTAGAWSRRLKANRYLVALAAGLLVGCVGFFLPQVMGTGYPAIESAIKGQLDVNLLAALLVLKLALTCVTLRFGGSGGLFVPSIFLGAMAGAIYEAVMPGAHDPALVMAAMAASIAVTNKTLLTGIAFVAETCGPSSLVLTLITGATAYFVSGEVSFYAELQPLDEPEAEEAMISTVYHKAESPESLEKLRGVKIRDLMHADPFRLVDAMSVQEASSLVMGVSFKEYPITDAEGRLTGALTLEEFLLCEEAGKKIHVGDLPTQVPQVATPDMDLIALAPVLLESKMDNIYVVEDLKSMRLVGVVNETEVLKAMLKCVDPFERDAHA